MHTFVLASVSLHYIFPYNGALLGLRAVMVFWCNHILLFYWYIYKFDVSGDKCKWTNGLGHKLLQH